MAHVVFITTYYPPEKGAAVVRVSETAKRLVKRGHRVTVLTTVPNYPTGIVPPKYRGHLVQEEELDGVHVIRVWSYATPNRGFVRRVIAQCSFGCLAPLLSRGVLARPDVLIVESHPLFNAIAGRVLARRYHCPFIFTVSDLWPESAIQLGILRNPLLIRLAEWLEWSTYRRASRVWAVTAGIRQALLQRGLTSEHVFLLTNGVDIHKFCPLPQAFARAELSWDSRFTVLYAGTHGISQGLATVLEAAERLQSHTDIRFVLVGDGATKADLVAQAQERDLQNVTFLEPQPYERMPVLLAASDICLVPLRKVPLFEGALPSKMYEAMACARPIVLGVDGEARRIAEDEAGAAMFVEPENAEALASGILYFHEHPEESGYLGMHGRAYVEARFDRDQLIAELDGHIARVTGEKMPVSSLVGSIALSLPDTPIPQAVEEKSRTY